MKKKKKENAFEVTRDELGLSARALSLALGFSESYWTKFENEDRNLTGELNRRLQAFYFKKMKKKLPLERFAGY